MKLAAEHAWFAVHTLPGHESAAESRLRGMAVETFLPYVRRMLRHARRHARPVRRPLFGGYLFARFAAAECWRAVNSCPGVLHVLGTSDGPQPLPEHVIGEIRRRQDADGLVQLEEHPLAPGDAVRIAGGTFTGWNGIFERNLSDADRAAILITYLHHSCRVVVRRDEVERVGPR